MSAMHHDTSSDLRVVGSKLKNVLEVRYLPKLLDKIEIIQPCYMLYIFVLLRIQSNSNFCVILSPGINFYVKTCLRGCLS